MINNNLVTNPNIVLSQGNVLSAASLGDLTKITQSDIESSKQEWKLSSGKFALLLFADLQRHIQYKQIGTYKYDNSDPDEPEFYYDPGTGKYYYSNTGNSVAESVITKIKENRLLLAREELLAYENALVNQRITLDSFQSATGKALKNLYIQNYALGNGGFSNTSEINLSQIESILSREMDRIRRVGESIRQQQLSRKQLSTVLSNTVRAGNTVYFQGKKDVARLSGNAFAQRFLGNTIDDRHCRDCLAMVARGVQPIDQVPMPGSQCECSYKCKCSIVFYRSLSDAVGTSKQMP